MKNTNLIIIIAVLVGIGVIAVIALQFGGGGPSYSTPQPTTSVPQSVPQPQPTTAPSQLPKATGNVDDAVAAILQGVSDEQLFLSEEDSDTSLITLDDQEIANFGQAYDESQL